MDSSKYPATNLGIFFIKVPEIFYFGFAGGQRSQTHLFQHQVRNVNLPIFCQNEYDFMYFCKAIKQSLKQNIAYEIKNSRLV